MTEHRFSLEEQLYLDKGIGNFLKRVLYVNFVPRLFKDRDEEFWKKSAIDWVSPAFELAGATNLALLSYNSKALSYLGMYLAIDGIYRLGSLWNEREAGRGPATLALDLISLPVYKLSQRIKKQTA